MVSDLSGRRFSPRCVKIRHTYSDLEVKSISITFEIKGVTHFSCRRWENPTVVRSKFSEQQEMSLLMSFVTRGSVS